MAFDIAPYIDRKPSEIRRLTRKEEIDSSTARTRRGYTRVNLVILPREYTADLGHYAKKDLFICPILEIVKRSPRTYTTSGGGNICSGIPRY